MVWRGNRKSELPSDWQAIRKAVMERDGYRCRHVEVTGLRCNVVNAPYMVIDHINDKHDHSLTNLQLLCHRHNAIRTGAQGAAAREARRKRPAEPHPGLIRRDK